MDVTKSIHQLRQLIECPVCMEEKTDMRMLSCSHTFCLECLEGIERVQRLFCPLCRDQVTCQSSDLPRYPHRQDIQEVIDNLEKGNSQNARKKRPFFGPIETERLLVILVLGYALFGVLLVTHTATNQSGAKIKSQTVESPDDSRRAAMENGFVKSDQKPDNLESQLQCSVSDPLNTGKTDVTDRNTPASESAVWTVGLWPVRALVFIVRLIYKYLIYTPITWIKYILLIVLTIIGNIIWILLLPFKWVLNGALDLMCLPFTSTYFVLHKLYVGGCMILPSLENILRVVIVLSTTGPLFLLLSVRR